MPEPIQTTQHAPTPMPRVRETPITGRTTEGMPSTRRDQETKESTPETGDPEEGETEEKLHPTPTVTQSPPTTMMRSTALMTTELTPSPRFPPRTTRGTSESIRATAQGGLSTLSSIVRPTPTTATRTIASTQEDSRDDALATVRRVIGTTSTTTIGVTLTVTTAPQGMRPDMSNRETQPISMITETRLTSPPPVSRIT